MSRDSLEYGKNYLFGVKKDSDLDAEMLASMDRIHKKEFLPWLNKYFEPLEFVHQNYERSWQVYVCGQKRYITND